MRQAPTSGVHGTAGADIAANAASFGRHLRAANKAPATIHAYLDAVARFDAYLEQQRHAVTSFRSLVCAFYDLSFSFREFLNEYPHLHSSIVDTLVGNVFNDLTPLYDALGKFAKREARTEISATTA